MLFQRYRLCLNIILYNLYIIPFLSWVRFWQRAVFFLQYYNQNSLKFSLKIITILIIKYIMDLQTLYDDIRDYALNTQGVNSYTIGDPYLTWNSLHMTYGCFNAALNYVEYEDNDCKFYMTLYYGDKLKNDSANVYEVQNTGFNAIRNVVSHLVDNYELEGVETLRIYPFTQKFADTLAGAYADVVVYVPIDNCFDFDKEV